MSCSTFRDGGQTTRQIDLSPQNIQKYSVARERRAALFAADGRLPSDYFTAVAVVLLRSAAIC